MGRGVMTFLISVTDEETGDVGTKRIAEGDYFLLTTGRCELTATQAYPTKGTVQLTIKNHRPGPTPEQL